MTMPESPTWPTYALDFLMKRTVAVEPEVLGKPDGVFGQFAIKKNKNFNILIIYKSFLEFFRSFLN